MSVATITPLVPATLRAATYLRISLDATGEELGVARQRQALSGIATSRGWAAAVELSDNDLSAAGKIRRPGFERLLRLMETGQVDVVLAYAFDRIARNSRDAVRFLEAAKAARVRVVLANGGELDLDSPMGMFVAELMGNVAKLEITTKGARQKLANAQRAERGIAPVTKRLFGFTRDKAAHVPAEADAVRAAFDRVLAGGSVRGIIGELNGAGLFTPLPDLDENGLVKGTGKPPERGGKPWTAGKVHGLLRNPQYAGFRVYDGQERPGTWEPIVDPEKWRAVQRILDDPDRFHGKPLARRWVGGGLYLCGPCADEGITSVVVCTSRSRTAGPVRIYKCTRKAHMSLKAEPVDALVRAVVCKRLREPDAADLLVDDTRPDTAALRTEAESLRVRIRGLGDLVEDGSMSPGEYKERKARLTQKLAEAEAGMQDFDRSPLLAGLVHADDVHAAFDALGLDQQRAVIDVLFTVTLRPAGGGRRAFDSSWVEFTPKA
ncbi:Site-specific DNA recombinase [Actinopolymorpha cephalotaxi]|uniref:Site-specific DNA recombinase n=1 Tax=Actinopolymorpha cephalotaxi TaxID=504797 RepID=A0A1I2ULY0_9ACTN|nr:recombinase family protein [Actinopolymorpha cephalotaxi]NYH86648.1 DNA invertase Pin-like site-specific DNA recombinase [Actinopolymorpha cephalotaxi]SFG78050.1 Site-specific DNA recombinase [Actinopolymorpha cephalotaxi]